MPRRRSAPGTCWAIGSVRCYPQPMRTSRRSLCCLFQRTRRQRRGHPRRAVAPCALRNLTSATTHVVTWFAMSKGDRLHLHIRQLHSCGSVRKSMENTHGQVGPRHWCFRRRRRQSLPQSRHPSPWPWPLGQIGIGKTTATQTQTSSGRRQGPIPGARP